jgi:mRNA interferase RelE/StbE
MNIQARIKKAIEQRLGTAPYQYGERLRRSLIGLWKLRVGDCRIVYEIKGQKITIWLIAFRKLDHSDRKDFSKNL